MHKYSYELNSIISNSNMNGNGHLENFSLNLDNFLVSNPEMTEQADQLTNMVINFLHGLSAVSEMEVSEY